MNSHVHCHDKPKNAMSRYERNREISIINNFKGSVSNYIGK